MERTAKAIREAIKGEGRAYIVPILTSTPIRIINARECKGELQVRTPNGWHTVLTGDTLYAC